MEFGSSQYFQFILDRSQIETSVMLRRHLDILPNPANCASLDSYWLRLAQICDMPLGDFKAVEGMQRFVHHTWTQGRDQALRQREVKEMRQHRRAKKHTAEAALAQFISYLPPAKAVDKKGS